MLIEDKDGASRCGKPVEVELDGERTLDSSVIGERLLCFEPSGDSIDGSNCPTE